MKSAEAHTPLFSASDAYCLLEIYEKLCKDPESFGLSSDLTGSLVGKSSMKPRAKKQLNKQEVLSPSVQVCKHLQRAACCSRPLQIICCRVCQSHYEPCLACLFLACSQDCCSKHLPLSSPVLVRCGLSFVCLGSAFPTILGSFVFAKRCVAQPS